MRRNQEDLRREGPLLKLGLLNDPRSHDHHVQFYNEKRPHIEAVVDHLIEGASLGEGLLILATATHATLIRNALETREVDTRAMEDAGRLRILDAEETVARVMDETGVHPDRFNEVIGGALDEMMRDDTIVGVRAYGELVDVLWQRDELDAALHLEALWNELLQKRRVALLCGYRLSLFDSSRSGDVMERLAHDHTRVTIAEDQKRADAAVVRAFDDVLGPARAAALRPLIGATVHLNRDLGAAERLLFWLRRNLPRRFEAVLERARHHYKDDTSERMNGATVLSSFQPVRILLVEDDPDDVFITAHAFQGTPQRTLLEVVDDGDDAEAFLRGEPPFDDAARHARPDLVLLDLRLPRRGGLEVLASLKEDPQLASIPVIVLSSATEYDTIRAAYRLGANAVLSKDGDMEMLDSVAAGIAIYAATWRRDQIEDSGEADGAKDAVLREA